MIAAALDVGSNTARMLIAQTADNILTDRRYYRQVTRLAGDFHPDTGLAQASMERTLRALEEFAAILSKYPVENIAAVGTAALRNAPNSRVFLEELKKRTGLDLKIIDGEEEARLSCRGILSVLKPQPARAILFDIGGGSTEIVLWQDGHICLQKSFPLGAVRLFEDYPATTQYQELIRQGLASLLAEPGWVKWKQDNSPIELVGTAGTVTTLAALKLKMTRYVGEQVNNLILTRSWLEDTHAELLDLTIEQRLSLPGMEEGRADIIIPGLQIVHALLDLAQSRALRVADAGILEGLLLE